MPCRARDVSQKDSGRLSDEYRAGRPRSISDVQVAEIIKQTLETTPKDATHWSICSMAAETGYSHTTIRRIWNAFGLQPHRSETFKLSTDPLFVDKISEKPALMFSRSCEIKTILGHCANIQIITRIKLHG